MTEDVRRSQRPGSVRAHCRRAARHADDKEYQTVRRSAASSRIRLARRAGFPGLGGRLRIVAGAAVLALA